MLSSTQWDWLKEELAKEAEITVIVSGVQAGFNLLKHGWGIFQEQPPTPLIMSASLYASPLALAIIAPSYIDLKLLGAPANRPDKD